MVEPSSDAALATGDDQMNDPSVYEKGDNEVAMNDYE